MIWAVAYVFGLGFITDYLWARIVQNIHAARPAVAASQSVALAAPSLFGFVEVSQDLRLAPAYLAGLWVGMYVALRTARTPESGLKEKNVDN